MEAAAFERSDVNVNNHLASGDTNLKKVKINFPSDEIVSNEHVGNRSPTNYEEGNTSSGFTVVGHGVVETPILPKSEIKVIMSNPLVTPVGPRRTRMRCYHCGTDIKTKITKSSKAITHISSCFLCIFTCCLLFWVPYCMSSCKKVDHSCPNCGSYLGTYNI